MEWYPTPSYLVKRKVILDFLEVGSGAGDLLYSLEKRGYTGLGIDLSSEVVELARNRLTRGTVNTENKGLDEVSGEYSIVIASEVLEHHEDDIGFLKKLRDRLKDGGYLLITVPARMDKWGTNDEFCGHVRRYERDELREKIRESGLDPLFRDAAITNIPHITTLSFPRAFGGNPSFKAGCPTESFGHDRRINGISVNSKSLIYSYGVPVYNIMKPFLTIRCDQKGGKE